MGKIAELLFEILKELKKMNKYLSEMMGKHYTAVPVPPHGRLIDADAFLQTIRPITDEDSQAACTFETVKRLIIEHITSAPTIIEAEEGET